MRKLIWPGVALLALGLEVSRVDAGPTGVLSSPVDLTHLTVGQQVPIEVSITGLPANDFIFVLDTKVLFPSISFTPVPDPTQSSGLTPGPIIGVPSQQANFNALSSLAADNATGNFSDSMPQTSQAIGTNGLYYSFLLQANAVGSGTIQFDAPSTQYAANDTAFALAPLPTSGSLSFTIFGVPEAGSLNIALIGLSGFGIGLLAARRRTGIRQAAQSIK